MNRVRREMIPVKIIRIPIRLIRMLRRRRGRKNRKRVTLASGDVGKGSRNGKKRKHIGNEDNHGGSGEIRSVVGKSQLLIDILDLIRSHPRGSLFGRRLRSQETKHYKSLVKQRLDIATIQRKLKQGSYDSSSLSFYRDLQLFFTNAIIFFPSSSSESMAAHELRTFVSEEMRKKTGKSGPKLIKQQASAIKTDAETSESSLSRQKSSALVVCKKRSVVSAKASPSSSSFSQKEETKEETLSEEKENIATGVIILIVYGLGKVYFGLLASVIFIPFLLYFAHFHHLSLYKSIPFNIYPTKTRSG